MSRYDGWAPRAFLVVVGAVFASAGISGVIDATRQDDAVEWWIAALIFGCGAWSALSGVLWLRIRPGRAAGGGPAFARVDLLAGEQVLAREASRFGPAVGRKANQSGALGRYPGILLVSDRRIIFLGWRFYFPTPRVSIPYLEVAPGADSLAWRDNVLDVRTRDGQHHRFELTSSAVFEAVRSAIATAPMGDVPYHVSRAEPARRVRPIGIIALGLSSFVIALGSTEAPFTHAPDSGVRMILLAVALAAGAWSWLRRERPGSMLDGALS